MDLAHLRLSYTKAGLLETDAHSDPFEQFRQWFGQASQAGLIEPNAMTLATADEEGNPNARTVLLKAFAPDGFVFYSNAESRKGRELSENARAALLFYWGELERQVRVSGPVQLVSEAEADAYFASRPKGHQLGAWVSDQSAPIKGREVLERKLVEVADQFESGPIPRPPYWVGYRVVAHAIEFWQGRPNRLHDRLEYIHTEEGWARRRLSP